MLLTLAACTTTKAGRQLQGAYGDQAKADIVDDALGVADREVKAARDYPALPAECGKRERIGAVDGDRFDVIGKKADLALGRANRKIQRCYRLSEENRKAWSAPR